MRTISTIRKMSLMEIAIAAANMAISSETVHMMSSTALVGLSQVTRRRMIREIGGGVARKEPPLQLVQHPNQTVIAVLNPEVQSRSLRRLRH